MKHAVVTLALVAALGTTACARQIGGDVYDGRTLGEAVQTETGRIESSRTVQIDDGDYLEQNAIGGVIGGVGGGVLGSQVGGGSGSVLASVGGAILGATLGALAEDEAKKQPATEYIVRLDSGQLVTIVQTGPLLGKGQPVYVQRPNYGRARVIPAG